MTTRREIMKAAPAVAIAAALPTGALSAPIDRSTWNVAMRSLAEATSQYEACLAGLRSRYGRAVNAPMDEQWQLDGMIDNMGDAEVELMGIPAPDLPALRWKLEKILEPCHNSTQSWDYSYVEQTIADIERLLK